MTKANPAPNFSKYADGLIPAIVQDAKTNIVLMLGFMNQQAYDLTLRSGLVSFFSRTKNRLWTKGEESKNYLHLKSIVLDCDNDTFLIKAIPDGPVCHTGDDTCFREKNTAPFLNQLETIINKRKESTGENSYVASLFEKGLNAIAQKVGEEAVELVIESKDHDDDRFVNEAADLLFHYLVLLNYKGKTLSDIEAILEKRHQSDPKNR